MKSKITFFSLCFFLITNIISAQKVSEAKSIISSKTVIKKYHDKEELDNMKKGELMVLYIERIKSLVKILPYIALATKPGVNLTALGIPNNKENRRAVDDEFEASDTFVEATVEFQEKMLPYSDTGNIVAGILFYEDIMKSLHRFNEFQ